MEKVKREEEKKVKSEERISKIGIMECWNIGRVKSLRFEDCLKSKMKEGCKISDILDCRLL